MPSLQKWNDIIITTTSSKSSQQKLTLSALLGKDNNNEPVDDLHLPDVLPGQYFHVDFGFMRTKEYQQEDVDEKT